MSVAIIDYGSGNLRSVEKAVEHAVAALDLNVTVKVTSRPEDVLQADRIILPGVGAFGDCVKGLRALDGMVESLEQRVLKQGQPFLGICVGMQLLATEGHEHGTHHGLDWIGGCIEPLDLSQDPLLKVPHMGWNQLQIRDGFQAHPVLDGIHNDDHVYFVHSYYFRPKNPDHVMVQTQYGCSLAAMVGRDNILGTQFHPEKSQRVGLRLIENFLQWRP